jgi:predicted signal transduction protein with EAL and GGDEF domain
MRRTLEEGRRTGIRVVAGDFGKGFAALHHLRGLHVDVLEVKRCPGSGDEEVGGVVANVVPQLATWPGKDLRRDLRCAPAPDALL